METISYIKSEINKLYETAPNIHICIKQSRSKTTIETVPAEIKGVYPKFFCIEEHSNGHPKAHSVQYAEILTGQVYISELGQLEKEHKRL